MKNNKAVGKWQRKEIKYIMKNFDFHKMRKVMQFLNWRWQDDKTPPSITELKSKAKSMLEDTILDNADNCSGGGLHVEYSKKYKRLNLYFVVEQAGTL